MSEWLEWALSFVALVTAIILHEVSHGYAALALGDDTAQAARAGCRSIRWCMWTGSAPSSLPGMFLVVQALAHTGGGVFFGWAKPVPIAPWRFADPRRGMMLVALAGPLMNYAAGLPDHPGAAR